MRAEGDQDRLLYLRSGMSSIIVDAGGLSLPSVLHWGADLGDLSSDDLTSIAHAADPAVPWGTTDRFPRRSILRQHSEGHFGRPSVLGHRDGRAWTPLLQVKSTRLLNDRLEVEAFDPLAGLEVRTELERGPSGLVRLRHSLRNQAPGEYVLDQLTMALPIPVVASELLDLSGHWGRERHPQRHPLMIGTWTRESRRGRTGHDATLGLLVGTPSFGARHGEVWAVHVAWSGNHLTYAERLPNGEGVIGGGELLMPGEVRLAPGDVYETPWCYAAYSSRGMDGVTSAFHEHIRSRPNHPPRSRPRPVVLNTWEAVYFDLSPGKLRALADEAAAVGVERFVLDDGWFRNRRDDSAGLGDWYPDESLWPGDEFSELIAHVRSLGMEFGLWIEPEMVSHDSDVYRAHPEWILRVGDRLPLGRRGQQVLDLAQPAAYDYVRSRLHALLADNDISALKWDHNRDLIDAGHDDRAGVHLQTRATYRLLEEIRHAFPHVEIESSSSGGARVDLGILDLVDRVWPSDAIDALERQAIQRWTQLLIPPELVGTHVGAPRVQTTGRVQDLSFRVATAFFGSFGVEWDITSATLEERSALARAIRFYKEHRELLHTGEVVHADHPDPAALVHGVVARDGSEGLFAYVQMHTSRFAVPAPARLPGLSSDRAYRVTPVAPAGEPFSFQLLPPSWFSGSTTLRGAALEQIGLSLPVLGPEQAVLVKVDALDS